VDVSIYKKVDSVWMTLTSTVSPLSFLKNPMILMAVVSMGLMFGMPKLMENSTLSEPSH
jgi:hypothetical protein